MVFNNVFSYRGHTLEQLDSNTERHALTPWISSGSLTGLFGVPERRHRSPGSDPGNGVWLRGVLGLQTWVPCKPPEQQRLRDGSGPIRMALRTVRLVRSAGLFRTYCLTDSIAKRKQPMYDNRQMNRYFQGVRR